jgi:hypothetical protein
MEDLIKYLEKELERAKSIYEPLDNRMETDFDLDTEEITEMDYYQGYADGIRATLNKILLIQENK